MEDRTYTETPSSPTPAAHSAIPPKKESFMREMLRFTLVALLIVIPIRMFIAQPFIVQGASMEPTFETGEYLIVDQVTYRLEVPERGDVIVFKYPKDPSKYFIKRIIGLPGDTVTIKRDSVVIKNSANPQGFTLEEPYIREMSPDTVMSASLGPDEYFVMGDNRNASSDSRVWGTLPAENIVGRALVRLLPVTDAGVLPGKFSFSTDH